MIRKFVLAAAAIAALGTASLIAPPTPAAAAGAGGGFHHFHGRHFHGGAPRLRRATRLLPAHTAGS